MLFTRAPSPQRPERRSALVEALLLLHGIIVEIQTLTLIPTIPIDRLPAPVRARKPLRAVLCAGVRALAVRIRVCLDARRERCEIEVLLELKLVVKHLAYRSRYVDFVLVQQRLQVDRAEVGAALLEAVCRVVARLTHRTVVQEVLVELGFADRQVVVAFAEFVDGQSVLRRVRLDDVREVRRLCLRRDTHACRAVAREPGLGVDAGLRNPNGVILFDGRLYRALKPLSVSIKIRPIELVVDLKRHVGEEWWLRTGEVVGAAAVQDLVVVSNLKDEVLDDSLGHLHLAVDEKSEGDKVGIPIVQLFETDKFDRRAPAMKRIYAPR